MDITHTNQMLIYAFQISNAFVSLIVSTGCKEVKCDKNNMVIGGNNPETGSNGLGFLLLLTLVNSGAKNS